MDSRMIGLIIAVVIMVVCGTASSSLAPLVPATGVVTDVDLGFFHDRLVPYGDWQS